MKMTNVKKAVALAAILGSVSVFGAANQIDLTAKIGSKALVGFSDLSTSTETGSVFVDDTLNSIDFGTESAGTAHTAVSRDLYVSTNNAAGVNMTITDTANSGNLKHATSGDTIDMAYTFDGSAITLGTAFNVATGTNSGSTPVGQMVFTPSASAAGSAAGTYSTTLTVTIAAN